MEKSALPLRSRFSGPERDNDGISTESLSRYLEDWLSYCELERHSRRTIQLRRGLVNRLLRWLWASNHASCGRHELRRFFTELRNEVTGQEQRPSTADTYHRNYSAFFNWLVEEEVISESPMKRIPKPRVPKDQIQPLSDEQVSALIEAARYAYFAGRDSALLLFLLDTGVRASEVAELTLGRLDLTNRRAVVVGKGNKERSVQFGKRTARALYHYLRDRELNGERPVFRAESGPALHEPLTRSGVYQIISALGKRAGLQACRCSPHTLRHTFAVNFLRNGGNLLALKLLLGHESLAMTNRYVALAQADLEEQHRVASPVDRISTRH